MKRRESWRGRRARQTLFGAAALFVLAQVAAGLILDHACPLLRFPSARHAIGRMVSRPSAPEVVFLGSSRMAGAIHDHALEAELERSCGLRHQMTVLNAAVPGGDPTAQERVLEEVLKRGVRPRLVVIEVGPEFFTWYSFCAGMNGVRLLRWHEIPPHLPAVAAQSSLWRLAAARLVPLYQHREQFWALAAGQLEGPITAGDVDFAPPQPRSAAGREVPADAPPAEPLLSAEQRGQFEASARTIRATWLRDYQVVPTNVDAVRRMIDRCREIGCDSWLLTPPLSAPFRAAYGPDIERAYQEVVAGLGCRHVDCRGWVPDGFFNDSHHLGHEGGRLFSKWFAARSLAPYWAQAGWATPQRGVAGRESPRAHVTASTPTRPTR